MISLFNVSRNAKAFLKGLVTIAVVLSLVGCSLFSDAPEDKNNIKQTLRIGLVTYGAFADTEKYFRQDFLELYEITHPNTKIEIRSVSAETTSYDKPVDTFALMKELMTGNDPVDLVVIEGLNQLPKYLENNLLAPLDTFIAKGKFDASKLAPGLIDGIKSFATDGKLYALAPLINSAALFYNRKMFDDKGIAYPEDGMTWEQTFKLAEQLNEGKGKDRTFGFAFYQTYDSDIKTDISIFKQALGLRAYDENAEKMTVNTPEWTRLLEQYIALRKSNTLPTSFNTTTGGDRAYFYQEPFSDSKVAMMIANYNYISEQLINSNESATRDGSREPIEWDVVTVPTHPEAPGVGGEMLIQGLMGLNAKAQNAEGAWDFMEFINGPEWARIKSRSQPFLSSHVDFAKPKEGLNYNIKAFLSLKPALPIDDSNLYSKYSYDLDSVNGIGLDKMEEVIKGKKKLKDVLAQWETEGNAKLQQLREAAATPTVK